MARTWLDVYQADSWSRLMQKLNRTQVAGPVTFTAPKFDVGGRLAAKREEQARMDALYAAERILKDIPEMLRNYHAIRKDSQYNLENRRKMLERIAARADQYLQAIGDPTTANRFTGMGKGDTNSILPWVRALKKKAENKAAYIAALERYTRQTKDKYRDPRLLIDFITKTPQKVGGGLYGLVPGVRMEKVDFMHRNFEFQLDHGTLTPHNGLDMAFKEWIAEAEAKNYEVPPFFVWLEKHPVCTGVNGDAYTGISKEHVTQYGTEMPAGGSGRVDIFMGAIVGGVVKGVPLAQLGGDRDARPQPFDTRQYGPHSKLPEGAAYVWGNDQFLYWAPTGSSTTRPSRPGRR